MASCRGSSPEHVAGARVQRIPEREWLAWFLILDHRDTLPRVEDDAGRATRRVFAMPPREVRCLFAARNRSSIGRGRCSMRE